VASAAIAAPPQIPGLASVAFTDPTQNRGLLAGLPPSGTSYGNPAANLAPIVFSAPDSGVHAVAVPTAPPGGQYQLWNRGADGTVSSLGVLTPSGSPVSVVTFERSSVDGLFMSLEPVGGSLQPTGPIVGGSQNPVLPGLGRP
ncbi:MAG: anti-sigma factor, partial [Verrucomicrobium sp.]|nr:anti-sigma factor [Verrucomicrobium sp.]